MLNKIRHEKSQKAIFLFLFEKEMLKLRELQL